MGVHISVCVPAFTSFGYIDCFLKKEIVLALPYRTHEHRWLGLMTECPPETAAGTCSAVTFLFTEVELYTADCFLLWLTFCISSPKSV